MQINPEEPMEAELEIYDDIGEETDFWTGEKTGISASSITDFLRQHESVNTINVHINSFGGYVFEGITIHNVLKGSGKKINVIIDGIAASIASVIAMAGDSIKMYPTSQMMIHNCWGWVCGNANDLRKEADNMDAIMESSKIAYLEKSNGKLSRKDLDKMLDEETYLTADRCYELGLCDEILGKQEADPDKTIKPDDTKKEKLEKQPTLPISQKRKDWFF